MVFKKAKKKLIFVISSALFGGAETSAILYAKSLKNIFDLTVICNGGLLYDSFKENGIKVKKIPLLDNADLLGFMRLYFYFKKVKPHIVHLHMNRATFLGAVLCRLLDLPHVASIQSFTKPLYVKFPKIITVCSPKMIEYYEKFGIPKENIYLLFNPVDLENINNIEKISIHNIFKIPKEWKIAIFVGRLHIKKGIKDILYFANRLKMENKKICIVMLGNGEEYNFMKRVIERNNLKRYVILAGYYKNPIPFIKASDIMILPSYNEGLPLSLTEGLACGKPFIAYDVGDIALLSEGNTGIIVKKGDMHTFYNSMLRMFDLLSKTDFSEYTKKIINKYFLLEKSIKQLLNIYNRAMEC